MQQNRGYCLPLRILPLSTLVLVCDFAADQVGACSSNIKGFCVSVPSVPTGWSQWIDCFPPGPWLKQKSPGPKGTNSRASLWSWPWILPKLQQGYRGNVWATDKFLQSHSHWWPGADAGLRKPVIDTGRSHLFTSVTLVVTGFTHMKLKTEGHELTGSYEVTVFTLR